MCRWLKLTEKEIHGKCHLFEFQLRSCHYEPPEDRPAGAAGEEMDCAVKSLRTRVSGDDVGTYVEQLGECIDELPASVNASCDVGLGLLRSNINEWKQEAKLKGRAGQVAQDLGRALDLGKAALKSRSGEQKAIDALAAAISRAEQLPGHYLVDEVHAARMYLDRLAPIPAVREQITKALEVADRAFETTILFTVKEAIVWLEVAVNRGKRYNVGDPTAKGEEALEKLAALKVALLDLKAATFHGNVSLSTKSEVMGSTMALNASIARAKHAGLRSNLPVATELLERLTELTKARLAEKQAAERAAHIANTQGMKSKRKLDAAIQELNVTIGRAQELGLGHNKTTSVAVWRMDQLLYIREARKALHRAQKNAWEVLSSDGGKLNDDKEEIALDMLGPAIKWSEDVDLWKGLTTAKQAAAQLEALERAKEHMAVALELGNATLRAESHVRHAIRILEKAVVGSGQANSTAGVPEAERQLKELRKLHGAKRSIHAAEDEARDALKHRSGYEKSMESLKRSIKLGRQEHLHHDDHVALEQLRSMATFVKAEEELMKALVKMAPESPEPSPEPVVDERHKTSFKRTGLRPDDLPGVPKGEDDHDADFREHEEALETALRDAAAQGLVDPQMKAQLASVKAKDAAHKELQAAIEVGDAAIETKKELDFAITDLSGRVAEADEEDMSVDTSKATSLLKKLKVIQPARDELVAAILEASVATHTVSGMDPAIMRIDDALKLNKHLELYAQVPKAEALRTKLVNLKMVYVRIRAAVTQGRIALQSQQGEEAAIEELDAAIEEADKIDMHRDLPKAVDVLHKLLHMNAVHQQAQAAMGPQRGGRR